MFEEDNTFRNFANWHIPAVDKELAASILAKMASMIDPEMDEFECYDIIFDFIGSSDINLVNLTDLVALLKCTKPNKQFDTFH